MAYQDMDRYNVNGYRYGTEAPKVAPKEDPEKIRQAKREYMKNEHSEKLYKKS